MIKRMLYPAIALLVVSVLLSSCSTISINSGKGTIQFIEIEGGFYGIIADDGEDYDPMNLEDDYPEFQVEGLRVRFRVKILNVFTIHMWGTPAEILNIERLEEE